MRVIGITGGVGAGKTRILEYLKENTNCDIIVADQVANKCKEPGQPCYESIVALLGKEVLDSDGTIDRKKMASLIFEDGTLLNKVNNLIHPIVQSFILNKIEKEKAENKLKVIFLEAALLIEAGYLPYLDELWYIHVDHKERVRRLQEGRNYTKEKTESIIRYQLSEEEFLGHANVVINNSGSFEETIRQLEKVCQERNFWKQT